MRETVPVLNDNSVGGFTVESYNQMLKQVFKCRKRGSLKPLLNFVEWQSAVLSELFNNKVRRLYWNPVANTGKPPNCITSNCKTSYCVKEPIPFCTFIKISVPRQVFWCGGQNHIMS